MRALSVAMACILSTGCTCHTPVAREEPRASLDVSRTALADVNFGFDRYDLNQTARNRLQTTAGWMEANPSAEVLIEGHADERGTGEYNLALGERRADAARQYLRTLGVKDRRLSTLSYGEERPLDPGHTEEAWAKNRRAHFRVTEGGASGAGKMEEERRNLSSGE